jgi:hypothetical protein
LRLLENRCVAKRAVISHEIFLVLLKTTEVDPVSTSREEVERLDGLFDDFQANRAARFGDIFNTFMVVLEADI